MITQTHRITLAPFYPPRAAVGSRERVIWGGGGGGCGGERGGLTQETRHVVEPSWAPFTCPDFWPSAARAGGAANFTTLYESSLRTGQFGTGLGKVRES